MPLYGWFLAYNEGVIFSPSHIEADLTCQGSPVIFSTTIIALDAIIIYKLLFFGGGPSFLGLLQL